jgi:hypothetical protein
LICAKDAAGGGVLLAITSVTKKHHHTNKKCMEGGGFMGLFVHVLHLSSSMHPCRKKKLMSPFHASCLRFKKSINHKTEYQIKFRLENRISDNKNFETKSHLTIF